MRETIHASCVAFNGRGCLITGASGQGKSSLALHLMAYGAALVSDDQVALSVDGETLVASSAANIAGMIEARGVGLLLAEPVKSTPIHCVVDLNHQEQDRLPQRRDVTILGVTLPLLHNVDSSHFAPAILQFLRVGRHKP